jgi:hypothetical protein
VFHAYLALQLFAIKTTKHKITKKLKKLLLKMRGKTAKKKEKKGKKKKKKNSIYRVSSSSFPFLFFLSLIAIAFSLPPQTLFPSPSQLGIGHRLKSEIGSSTGAAFAAVPMTQETRNETISNEMKNLR